MQEFNIDAAKAELKKVSIEELHAAGFLSKARVGYICPVCNNGSGRDGTGATVKQGANGEELLCGVCQDGFDVIDILAAVWNLRTDVPQEFVEIVKRGCNRFGIRLVGDKAYSDRPELPKYQAKSPEQIAAELERIKRTISDAHKNLHALLLKHGGHQWRGLNKITLQDFFIGYLPDWYARKGAPTTPRIIIPTSFNHYLARLDGNIEDFNVPDGVHLDAKEHRGSKEIFNFKRALQDSDNPVCFVVEGEIDCMSIAQVTRQRSDGKSIYPVNVIATGGTNPAPAAFDQLKNLPSKKKFIILFDNDEGGLKAAPLLASKLRAFGHQAAIATLSEEYNDANDFLQADHEYLAARIEEILDEVNFDDVAITADMPVDASADVQGTFTTTNETDTVTNDLQDDYLIQLIETWRTSNNNSPVDTKILAELQQAKTYVDALTPENFQSADVDDIAIRREIALLKFYTPQIATKFFAVLKDAQKRAKDILKTIADETSELKKVNEPIPDIDVAEIKNLAALVPSKVAADVAEVVTQIKRDQKTYSTKKAQEAFAAQDAEKKREHRNATTKKIFPNCPVDLVLPDGVTFDLHRGIQRVDWDKQPGAYGRPIIIVAKTPIVPTKIFREPDKHITQYELAILTRGGIWRRIIVDGDEIADSKKILRLAKDGGALIVNAAHLCKVLAELIAANNDQIPEIRCYNQPGWHGDQFIYPTATDDYIVRRAGFNYDSEFATNGDADLWKKIFLDACELGGAATRIFIGFALDAPLVRRLNLANTQIQISGKSGSGKTALVKLAASIYGNPRKLLRTFGATLKNRQAVAAAYNDLPTFLDELETTNGGKRGEDSLPQMIYDFSLGTANQANRRNGDVRETFEFFGSRLMTGERNLLKSHDQRGAYKRLVQLHVNNLFPDEFASELHLVAENNFGLFGRKWAADFVPAHLDVIQAKYLEFGKLFAALPNKPDIEPTMLKSIAIAALAYQYFMICIGEQSVFHANNFVRDIKAVIDTLPTMDELDDSTRALADLQSFIAGHQKFFLFETTPHPETGDEEREPEHAAFECYGKIFKNNEVAFFPTAIKKILENELGFQSADAIIGEWAQKGFLRCGKGTGLRFSTRISGKMIKAYRFNAGVLLTNDSNTPDDEEDFINY